MEELMDEGKLTLEDRRTLIELTRKTVEALVRKEPLPEIETVSPNLEMPLGAFVTLKKNDRLRGCIGYTISFQQLYRTVIDAAAGAALRDPRFSRVRLEELPDLTYEVSVLSSFKRIHDLDEIEIGVHGIMIKQGFHQGLLLPQVGENSGFTPEMFLAQTCRKAGLHPTAWRDPITEIEIFSADVFGEEVLS